jgi:hypothetical protein
MTEEEWLKCKEVIAMLRHLRVKLEERKVILLTVACFERVREQLPTDCRDWLDLLHGVGEGHTSPQDLNANWETVEWQLSNLDGPDAPVGGRFYSLLILATGGWLVEETLERGNAAWEVAEAEHAVMLRDIFGNPFRPVTLDPAWLTSDVLALARGIYDERAFDRMPILADALQDAGCNNDDVLNHCRDANAVHVRGCWLVDLLLGNG